jgi:BioD-like phosphotransacetylase family protein
MKALYVTSIQTFSGKTAICLGLGRQMQTDGFKVGYFKPLGTQPRQVREGLYHDEDALFARQVLGLSEPPEVLAPVCLSPQFIEQQLAGSDQDLTTAVIEAYNTVRQDKDVVILEGGASLREGYAVNMATPKVAKMLGAPVLAVVKYDGDVQVIDDALSAHARLGDQLIGVVINGVPDSSLRFAVEVATPVLERRRISVFGVLPEDSRLMATSIGEIADAADGQFLTHADKRDELVENLTVGAMGVEEARARLSHIPNKAVITGGDRAEMIVAALETSARLVILTGNLIPRQDLLHRAADMGVPVVLVPYDTLQTVARIERFFGKGRLAQQEKLTRLKTLLAHNFDFKRLYHQIGLMADSR